MSASKEEMLAGLKDVCVYAAIHGYHKIDPRVKAIKALIKNRPKVSRGFVRKWARKLGHMDELGFTNLCISDLEDMLTEAGVEVEKP